MSIPAVKPDCLLESNIARDTGMFPARVNCRVMCSFVTVYSSNLHFSIHPPYFACTAVVTSNAKEALPQYMHPSTSRYKPLPPVLSCSWADPIGDEMSLTSLSSFTAFISVHCALFPTHTDPAVLSDFDHREDCASSRPEYNLAEMQPLRALSWSLLTAVKHA